MMPQFLGGDLRRRRRWSQFFFVFFFPKECGGKGRKKPNKADVSRRDRGMTALWACCKSLMMFWWFLRVTTREPVVGKGRARTPTWSAKAVAPFIKMSSTTPMSTRWVAEARRASWLIIFHSFFFFFYTPVILISSLFIFFVYLRTLCEVASKMPE